MLEAIKNRHSVRSFSDKPIEEEKLKEILDAAESAPSAGGLMARTVIAVRKIERKRKLVEASSFQEFIAEAPVVLVFFTQPRESERKYGKIGKRLYCIQDSTISASFAWLEAINQGLGACWIGAFSEAEVKTILKVKQDWRPICIMPIGYEKLCQ